MLSCGNVTRFCGITEKTVKYVVGANGEYRWMMKNGDRGRVVMVRKSTIFIKSIICPIFWIIDNIMFYAMVRWGITDYMVVKPRLPCKFGMNLPCGYGYHAFILVYN
jgi:hypothetical protein